MPAHWLEWKAGQLTVQRYWQPKFDPDDSRTLEEWEDEISAAMKESVQAHKIADVEVGSFLSSGVDSSYMAALAHVDKTFTVGFANKQYDETDYAQEFSKQHRGQELRLPHYAGGILGQPGQDPVPHG